MKSYKRKIFKRGRVSKNFKRPTKDQIRKAMSFIDSGRIDKGGWRSMGKKTFFNRKLKDKLSRLAKIKKAKALVRQIQKNQNRKPIPLNERGDYEVIERIELDNATIPTRTLKRKFGKDGDYLELHVYNEKGKLLQSVDDFKQFNLPDQLDTDGLTNEINVEPFEVLRGLGYATGIYKLVINIQRNKLFNTPKRLFTLKEISPTRTELSLVANKIKNDILEDQVLSMIDNISNSPFFKDFILNFGNDTNELGINMALNKKPKKYEILIKLYEPLDPTIKKGTTTKITEEITDPILFTVDLGEPEPEDNSIPLRGPNFKIDTRLLNSVPSRFKNYDQALEYSLTSSYQSLLNRLEKSEIPEIQYDYIRPISESSDETVYHFENFVHFSSAKERINNFYYKLKLIETYDDQVADINLITGNTSGSSFVLENKELINKKKERIIKSLDGYEQFLYHDSGAYSYPKINSLAPYTLYPTTSSQALNWLGSDEYAHPKYGGQLLSASVYDRINQDNLLGLIPKHVLDNGDNEQYSLFVNMIGQHFDQIWSHIRHITHQKRNSHKYGVSKNMVYHALESIGIDTFDQFENANLIEYILGEGPAGSSFYGTTHYINSQSIYNNSTLTNPPSETLVTSSNEGSVPKGDITREIWKRLYHNAPYLLKTKGTERGIHALMSCYGLPSTILNVKEYGGSTSDKTTFKTFSYDKYAYELSGNAEGDQYFIKTDWSSSLTPNTTKKTVEFRIKPHRSGSQQHLFTLSGSSNAAVNSNPEVDTHLLLSPYTGTADISSSGDANQWGRLQLYTGTLLQGSTDYFPVFNGNFWNIHVVGERTPGDGIVTFGAYQANFNKNIFKVQTTSAITVMAPGYYDVCWGYGAKGAKEAYFGGVHDNGHSGYNIAGPLSYTGSLQEIRYYFGEALSNTVFTNHALDPFIYSGNSISSSFNNLVMRLPLGSNLQKDISSYHPQSSSDFIPLNSISSNADTYWGDSVEIHNLLTPDTVGASMTSEKVRIDTGTIDDNMLSPFIKSETSTLDRQALDYEDLGVFFSPQNEINEDIVYTLGGFRLDDYIGSPLKGDQTSSYYPDLNILKEKYFKKYEQKQRYSFWDYTKTIQYLDHTLFKIIEQHVPAKANLKTGLLIEPHYLERNKFARNLPEVDDNVTMTPGSYNTLHFQIDPEQYINTSGSVVTQHPLNINVSGYILDEEQHGAQAPINPTTTDGVPPNYKMYLSSTLLGNARKGKPSAIYYRSLQLGKETNY